MFFCEFCEFFKNTYFEKDLQTASSETPVRGSLFNKGASLTARRLLTVLERDCRTGISLGILRNFKENRTDYLLTTTSHIMFVLLIADQ